MHWEKKICIRITLRRIVGAMVMASIAVNLAIVGAVLGAEDPPVTPNPTLPFMTSFWTDTPASFTPRVSDVSTITPTATQTHTATQTPTDTLTPTPSHTASPTLTACVKRFGWPIYWIEPGDTLSAIARATGSTVQELMLANCLESPVILAGQPLHVPRLPVTYTPTDTLVPDTPTGFETLATMNCDGPFYVLFSVRASDPDAILSVTALPYSSREAIITEIPLEWNGTTYSGSTELFELYTVADIDHYRFRAVDSLGNVTTSQPYSERSRSCIVLPDEEPTSEEGQVN